VTESFFHYIWQFQYFDKTNLTTTEGEELTVFKTGYSNSHAGPDFLNAKVKIGALEWNGHVEIHINASDWTQHQHHSDKGYDSVVLHVVWKNDKQITRSDQSHIPTLELKNRIAELLLSKHKNLLLSPAVIPCAESLTKVASVVKLSALEKALTQRLETKSKAVLSLLKKNNNDWQETCYQVLSKNFGFKVNAEAFSTLSEAVPCKTILKHADKLVQVEALLLGTAGLIEKANDDYTNYLQKEFKLLSTKYTPSKNQLHKTQWRLLRLRPANFPTIRIAQFATLLVKQKNIFSSIIAAESIQEVKQLFDVVQSSYWQEHYQFGKKSKKPVPGLGESAIENIIINTVAPLLAAYSLKKDEPLWMERAVEFLTKVKPENNSIIREWNSLGWKATSAFDSQAMIELKNNFCLKRLCLQCVIGSSLVKPI